MVTSNTHELKDELMDRRGLEVEGEDEVEN